MVALVNGLTVTFAHLCITSTQPRKDNPTILNQGMEWIFNAIVMMFRKFNSCSRGDYMLIKGQGCRSIKTSNIETMVGQILDRASARNDVENIGVPRTTGLIKHKVAQLRNGCGANKTF